MAWVLEQKGDDIDSDTTPFATLESGAPTDDNLLVSGIFTRASSVTANPTGFTTVIEVVDGGFADVNRMTSKIASGDGATFTYTVDPSDQSGVWVAEYSGNRDDATEDQTASNGPTSTITSQSTNTTPALQDADELAVAHWGQRDNTSGPSYTNAFTGRVDLAKASAPELHVYMADKFEVGPGGQETTCSWTTSTHSTALIATFRAPAAAGDLFTMARAG